MLESLAAALLSAFCYGIAAVMQAMAVRSATRRPELAGSPPGHPGNPGDPGDPGSPGAVGRPGVALPPGAAGSPEVAGLPGPARLPGVAGLPGAAGPPIAGGVPGPVAAPAAAPVTGVDPGLVMRMLGQWPFLVSIGIDLLGFLAQLVALARLPLFAVQAIIAANLAVTAVCAAWLMRVRLSPREWLAVTGVVAGVGLLGASAGAEGATRAGFGVELGLIIAVAVVAVAGLAAARLRGPYLAGLTLVVAVALPAVATVYHSVFHGDQGLSVYLPPVPDALGPDFPLERWQAWFAVAAALLTLLVLANLVRGRFGRSMRAIRDNEVAASLAGIPVARVQVTAFVVSAACAGLGGGMFAVLSQSVSPDAFTLTLSLNLLLAVVIGGAGSLAGAVWGSLLLVLLRYWADQLTGNLPVSPGLRTRLAGNLPLAVFGLLLIVVMVAAPGGVQGLLTRAGRRVRGRWKGRSARRAGLPAPEAEPPAPVASHS
jgi:branched-chain amino acid transport system permease protein